MFGNQNRRHFMKHVAGASALTLPGMSFVQGLRAAAPQMAKEHKSLIILWMGGGPSTIDIWDMKPGTPNGGEHKPVSTSAAGVRITEHLPTVAKQMKHLSVIRSLTTTEGDHDRGTTLMNTGRSPNPLVDYPHIGSIVALKSTPKELALPSFISVGGVGQRVGPGFLGMTYAPFTVQNPGQLPENISAPQGVTDDRLARRQAIFGALEGGFTKKTGMKGDAAQAHSDIYSKAFKLVGSGGKEVFTFDKEPTGLVEEYGGRQNRFGMGCLLARKLVEAGVTCVEVDLGGWDMHNGIFPALTRNLPQLDKGMGTLVKDLNDRGLWKNTVVVWMGDFGRTPKINQNAGRDHFPRCWSVVVGGGGIKGGMAYGSTDSDGTSVKDDPVKINDLYATLYKGLGIDPTPESNASVRDNLGRPFPIAGDNFKLIKELVG